MTINDKIPELSLPPSDNPFVPTKSTKDFSINSKMIYILS